jgi:hypothetical protein
MEPGIIPSPAQEIRNATRHNEKQRVEILIGLLLGTNGREKKIGLSEEPVI